MKKYKFYRHKPQKSLVSNKACFVKKNCKYVIGYLHNDNNVNPLHIKGFLKQALM